MSRGISSSEQFSHFRIHFLRCSRMSPMAVSMSRPSLPSASTATPPGGPRREWLLTTTLMILSPFSRPRVLSELPSSLWRTSKIGFKRNRNLQAETKNLPKQEFLFRFLGKLFLRFLVTVSVIGFKILILLLKPRSSGLILGWPKNLPVYPGSFL